jgi:hypothetical protein
MSAVNAWDERTMHLSMPAIRRNRRTHRPRREPHGRSPSAATSPDGQITLEVLIVTHSMEHDLQRDQDSPEAPRHQRCDQTSSLTAACKSGPHKRGEGEDQYA